MSATTHVHGIECYASNDTGPLAYTPRRADGLDRNLRNLNRADFVSYQAETNGECPALTLTCTVQNEPIKCRIQWIDSKGNPTADDNPAIGYVRTIGRTVPHFDSETEPNSFRITTEEPSAWYPICAKHARELWRLGNWTFKGLDE